MDYVFIAGNHLHSRFQTANYQQSHRHKHHFIIAETGFGTGLNFLLTVKLWLESPISEHKQLHFISVEQYPITPKELIKAHALWPELADLSSILRQHYPETLRGMHYRDIDFNTVSTTKNKNLKPPIKLTLLFNEAQLGFSECFHTRHPLETALPSEGVDAWFLDGFAPSKNPDMWKDSLFALIARLSFRSHDTNYTTMATFTAAGFVKRGLKQVGFDIKKRKGFGRKRDMLIGNFLGIPQQYRHLQTTTRKLGLNDFWPIYRPHKTLSNTNTVAIIGAGISGMSTAFSLAKAGFKVSVYDSGKDAMQEASGNPQAVLFPKLSPHKTALSEFNLLSLNYAVAHYSQINRQQPIFTQCGLLQCEANESAEQLKALARCFPQAMQYLTASEASTLSNTRLDSPAVFYPELGFVNTQPLKAFLLKQHGIQFYPQHTVSALQKKGEKWALDFKEHLSTQADFVVICNAFAAKYLLPSHNMPLNNIRGQITQFTHNINDQLTADIPSISTTICHKGYINPPATIGNNRQYSFGATFDLANTSTTQDKRSDEYNIQQLTKYLPDFTALEKEHTNTALSWQARVNFRCTTNDYMPVVGPVINESIASPAFDIYAKNAQAHIPERLNCHEGLFINTAYGSRGFTTAPICAAVITAYLTASIQPLPKALIKAIHPGRFYIKQRKQPQPKQK